MGIMNFYKSPKPKRFRYTPRFYDPKKEALQKKIDRARRKYYPEEFDSEDGEAQKDRIRGYFHKESDLLHSYKDRREFQKRVQEKNWVIFLLLGVLMMLFLWLYDNIGINFFNVFFSKYFGV